MKLMKEGSGVSMKMTYVEADIFVVVLAELMNSLNHGKDALLRRNVKAWFIKCSFLRVLTLESSFLAYQKNGARYGA